MVSDLLLTSVPLTNFLILLYVTMPFKADRCWINFCCNSVLKKLKIESFFSQVSSAIWIVLSHFSCQGAESQYLQEWVNQNVFKHDNIPPITLLNPALSRFFFPLNSFLSSPAQLLQLLSLALTSLTSLDTFCVLKSSICDQALPLASSRAWMLTSVALYTHSVSICFEDLWETSTRPIYFS